MSSATLPTSAVPAAAPRPRWPGLALGFGLALGVALVARPLAEWIGAAVLAFQGLDPAATASPVSPVPVAVILGLLVANTAGVPALARPGLDETVKRVLRLGIVLVGIKLSALAVLQVGLVGVPVVLALVSFALGVTLLLGRVLGVSRRLSLLAAASTAICGITATLAVATAIDADDREVAYTIANVTLFGLVAMLAYPYLAHALFPLASGSAGLFLGTAIHDTSQVMGAAMSYDQLFQDERALQVATVAKLTRNTLLVAVVPLLGWLASREATTSGGVSPGWRKLFPTFVLGFLGMAILRSAGDAGLAGGGRALGLLEAADWKTLTKLLGDTVATLALSTALAAVGLTTRLSTLRGLGLRPLLLGLSAALAVGLASLGLAALMGGWLG